jgi:hypothetical protein
VEGSDHPAVLQRGNASTASIAGNKPKRLWWWSSQASEWP